MRLIPQGEVGELIVAGRNLTAGYIRGRDTHKFLDNPYAIDPSEKNKKDVRISDTGLLNSKNLYCGLQIFSFVISFARRSDN